MRKEPSTLKKDSEDQSIISSIQMGIRRKRTIWKSRHWRRSFTEYKLVPYIFLPNSSVSINLQPKDC